MSDKPHSSDDARARREAELAEALRANLRRRKAAAAEPKSDRADPPLPPPVPRR